MLAALVVVGCGDVVPSSSPAAPQDVPEFPETSTATPDWLQDHEGIFWDHFGELGNRPAPPFGRARLTLLGCEETDRCEDFARGTTRYVRLERTSDGYRVMPQCSALYDMFSMSRPRSWHLTSGTLEAGATVEFIGSEPRLPPELDPDQQLPRLRMEIQRWWMPSSPPLYAWSDWLYVRSLLTARARWWGVEVSVHGSHDCDRFTNPNVHDACLASRGGPLALLMDPASPDAFPGEPPSRDPDHRARQRLLSPVSPGSWQGFCGRLRHVGGLTRETIEHRLRPGADALLDHGIDPARFVAGSLLTFEGQYYPLINVRDLADLVLELEWFEAVEPVVARLAEDPNLDWQNRFRAEAFLHFLYAQPVSDALLYDFVPFDPGHDAEASRLADEACVATLLGGMNLLCHSG